MDIVQNLVNALKVPVQSKVTRIVVYRYIGDINWDEVDSNCVISRNEKEAIIQVGSYRFNVEIGGRKMIFHI